MNKKITCRPWNVVDRVKHYHRRKDDRKAREFYVYMHDRLNEGGTWVQPGNLGTGGSSPPMILVRRGKNFVIDRNVINIRDYTNA